MASEKDVISVYDLRANSRAKVTEVLEPSGQLSSGSASVTSRRLAELGFIPGQIITRLHSTRLWGGPISCEVRGTHIALRRAEAKLVRCIVEVKENF